MLLYSVPHGSVKAMGLIEGQAGIRQAELNPGHGPVRVLPIEGLRGDKGGRDGRGNGRLLPGEVRPFPKGHIPLSLQGVQALPQLLVHVAHGQFRLAALQDGSQFPDGLVVVVGFVENPTVQMRKRAAHEQRGK